MMRRFLSAGVSAQLLRHQSSSVSKDKVAALVMETKIFDPKLVEMGVNRLIDGLAHTGYSKAYKDSDVAAHVQGVLAAEIRKRMGEPYVHIHEGEWSAFYVCENDPELRLRMVRRMATFVSRDPSKGSTTVTYSTEDGSLYVYTAVLDDYPEGAKKDRNCDDLSVIATKTFHDVAGPALKEAIPPLLKRMRAQIFPVFEVRTKENGALSLLMGVSLDSTNYIATLTAAFQEIKGAVIQRSTSFSFANSTCVYTFDIVGATAEQVEELASLVSLIPNRTTSHIVRAQEQGLLTSQETAFIDAAIIFSTYFTEIPSDDDYRHLRTALAHEPGGPQRLQNLRQTLTAEMMSERYAGQLIALYPEFVKQIYADFKEGTTEERRNAIAKSIAARFKEDQRYPFDVAVFKAFLQFNESIVKHNFYKPDKAALAFRLNPQFLAKHEYAPIPHGVFLFAGSQWRGFHIRFTDIARGGVRMIISKTNAYRKNKRSVFQENFNLAYTQLLKNKDIPEGGSKGTLLVSSRYLTKFDPVRCKHMFLEYVDAMLDVIIPDEKGVIDHLKQEEIIFLGPDENTAGTFPAAGALYSKSRGYKSWKSFTTGKDPEMGGIPHDEYGMTTTSVRVYVEGIYEKLGLEETAMRKFQTGGPDGDLGSNEILLSKEKMVAMVDISAVLHDPNGIDREELTRLAKARLPLREFDRARLSKDGFLVLTEDRDVTLPDGTVIEDGGIFRDEFHFTKYSDADVFVPCGGRPRSVTLENVGGFLKMDDVDGEAMLEGRLGAVSPDKLRFKIIVEGANLFITPDARLALERCGVTLIKDAAANKGGVTSSSLEVLAGLALSDEEHQTHMCVKDENNKPQFYEAYVQEILARIRENARLEFEAIWREAEANPTMAKSVIVDVLSKRNVEIRANMLSSDIFEDKVLMRYVLSQYIPKTLLAVVPVETAMERIPANYQHAICAMWLASNFVYSSGMRSNEFDFFNYMTEVTRKAAEFGKK